MARPPKLTRAQIHYIQSLHPAKGELQTLAATWHISLGHLYLLRQLARDPSRRRDLGPRVPIRPDRCRTCGEPYSVLQDPMALYPTESCACGQHPILPRAA